MSGWIGVDLDGTLAHHEHPPAPWDPRVIGAPVSLMVERVKAWLAAGQEVRIFTARYAAPDSQIGPVVEAIEAWCREHIGTVLEITNVKDYEMVELWDDRAIAVEANTGRAFGWGDL